MRVQILEVGKKENSALDFFLFYEKIPALRLMTGSAKLKGIIPCLLAFKVHAKSLWFVSTCKGDQFWLFLFFLRSMSGLSTSSEMNFDMERVPRSSSNILYCQYGRLIEIFLCENSSAMLVIILISS